MKSIYALVKTVLVVASLMLLTCAGALADIELFYDAALSNTGPAGNPWVVRMTSDTASVTPYAYIRYIPSAPIAFSALSHLSADFNRLQGTFVGGSPRFDIGLDMNNDGAFDWTNDRLLYVYWETSGTPATGWQNTGNVITDGLTRFDLQPFGGSWASTAAQAEALLGDKNIFRFYVSLDSGWAGTQVVDVDSFRVNNFTFNAEQTVPEPSAIALMGTVVALLGLRARRRRRSN